MDGFTSIVLLLIISILYLIHVTVHKKFDYWQKKNVPHIKPLPILGNYGRHILLQEFSGESVRKLCMKFPNAPYFGAFYGTEPVLIVQAPEILKHVFTKDFYYFNGREASDYSTSEVLTKNIFFSSGDSWKINRQMMTPLFSSGKMKNMFYLIERCSKILENMLDSEISTRDVIEVRDTCARYTMDCITSCAFGIEANAMLTPQNNPFRFMANEIFKTSIFRGIKINFRAIWPAIFYGLGFKIMPVAIKDFFLNVIKGVFEKRNFKASTRNDFVDQLLNLKQKSIVTVDSIKNNKSGSDEKVNLKINDDILVSQTIGLFGAGFETSAGTLGFTLFELAKNPDVQKRAAEEVDEFLRRRGNKLDFECINEVPYLEACINETLRKYPVLGVITREVMDNYTLPDGLSLEKGIRIHIPVYRMHYNPEYFPKPEIYKPERFLGENKKDVEQYTFLPFGEGPRMCLGQRFAKLQMLPGLITFLKKYRVELAEQMPENLTFDGRTFITQPKDQGIFLKFTEREGWEQRMYG